jgi:hypothetical protein
MEPLSRLGLGARLEARLGKLLLGLADLQRPVLLRLLHALLLLSENDLDVARAGLVGVDPTVRAVRPTAAVLGLVNLCSRNETPVSTCVRDLARESGTLGFSSAPQAAEWRRECLGPGCG